MPTFKHRISSLINPDVWKQNLPYIQTFWLFDFKTQTQPIYEDKSVRISDTYLKTKRLKTKQLFDVWNPY